MLGNGLHGMVRPDPRCHRQLYQRNLEPGSQHAAQLRSSLLWLGSIAERQSDGGRRRVPMSGGAVRAAVYDPAANTWTSIAPPTLPTPWANVGDAASIVLPDGTFMQSDCCGVALQMQSAPLAGYFNQTTQSWTELNQSTKFDEYDEEGWTLLPNGKVLTVDAYVACPIYQPAC